MTVKIFSGILGAKQATGIVVIIDVLRAATVAAYLLDKKISTITPVATKEEAFSYKEANSDLILVGEENGIKIAGFDLGNSPQEIKQVNNLINKHAVHRSTTGTQGLVNSHNADEVIFGTFVTCEPIKQYILKKQPPVVSLVSMGGLEDELFAKYLRAELYGEKFLSIGEIVQILEKHESCQWFLDPAKPDFPKEDFYLSLQLDVFKFFPIIHNDKVVSSTELL